MRRTLASVFAAGLLALLGLWGCSPATDAGPAPTPPPEAKPTFINRVWKVADSNSVAPGQLYVFLPEGTLVIASETGTPSLGKWSAEGKALTMVEEGIPYKAEILALDRAEFRLRVYNPGEPVEIRFVPAEGP